MSFCVGSKKNNHNYVEETFNHVQSDLIFFNVEDEDHILNLFRMLLKQLCLNEFHKKCIFFWLRWPKNFKYMIRDFIIKKENLMK